MSQNERSFEWNRIKHLRPRLSPDIEITPLSYRGKRWYVLRNTISGTHMRFSALAYELIGRLDGEQTLHQIWRLIYSSNRKQLLSRDEIVTITGNLLSSDALLTGVQPATETLLKKDLSARKLRWQQKLLNPLALRFPVLDPDRFLNATLSLVKPLFSVPSLLLWICMVFAASLLAFVHSDQLTDQLVLSMSDLSNLPMVVVLFILMKTIHELSHAYAVKNWGGEVHEMGISLLVFVPAPYVDATASWAFRDKKKRAFVSAAGIVSELFLASAGLFIWLATEPGTVNQAALFVFATGAVSTILFNANPLLRFDGYFVLQDMIEIPNLASRSSGYYRYLLVHYLFGVKQFRSPATEGGERLWFLSYGISAFLYRLFVLSVIVLMLIDNYMVAGIALAVWAVTLQLVLPVFKGMRYILTHSRMAQQRFRALSVSFSFVALLLGGLFMIPAPLTTYAHGVVWATDQAEIFAAGEGFVTQVHQPSGARVEKDVLLITLHSPSLEKRIAELDADRRIAQITMAASLRDDPLLYQIARNENLRLTEELSRLTDIREKLSVRSKSQGVFVIPDETKLEGRFFAQGDLLGYVINRQNLIVRTVIRQADIGMVNKNISRVQVRLAKQLNEVITADVLHVNQSGSDELPSLALSVEGGGQVVVNRHDSGILSTQAPVFEVDLSLPVHTRYTGVGERAYVLFSHGEEALGFQWLRRLRQVFLGRLTI